MSLSNWLKRLGNRNTSRSSRKSARSRRCGLEVLERRDVPTVSLPNLGYLLILGTGAADKTTVQISDNKTPDNPYDDHLTATTLTRGRATTQSYPLWHAVPGLDGQILHTHLISTLIYHGGLGNDTFTNKTSIPAYTYGDAGNDWLYAGPGNDHLYGEGGNDHLFGGDGQDVLEGGAGQDVLVSIGGGSDALTGGQGDDSFWKDTTDTITDVSTAEQNAGRVHDLSAFSSYSYNGGNAQTPVSLERHGQDLADPLPGQLGLTLVNYRSQPLFGSKGPQLTDIQQGGVADSYFLSTLGAIVKANPGHIREIVADLGDGTYAVQFHDAQGKSVVVRVDADLWTDAEGSPVFAGFGPQNALCVPIIEKAWAFFRTQEGNYPSIAGADNPGVPLDRALNLTAFSLYKTPASSTDFRFIRQIELALAQGLAVTLAAPAGFSDKTPMTEDKHLNGQYIYVVDSVLPYFHGNPMGIKLYNPDGSYVTIHTTGRLSFCSFGFTTFKV